MSTITLRCVECLVEWSCPTASSADEPIVVDAVCDDCGADEDDDGVCPDCDEIHDMCECHVGEDCGRWSNGRLTKYCAKAGSEECDFECPYRNSLKFG